MLKIDKVEWGKMEIKGKKYGQVLIVGNQIFERDSEKLHQLFDTTHKIGDWEVEKLFSDNPELIIIGTGWAGVLGVSSKALLRGIPSEYKVQSAKLGIELKILKTPKAVKEYNKLTGEGKKVNALIHTTC